MAWLKYLNKLMPHIQDHHPHHKVSSESTMVTSSSSLSSADVFLSPSTLIHLRKMNRRRRAHQKGGKIVKKKRKVIDHHNMAPRFSKLVVNGLSGDGLTKIKNPIITINKNSFRTNNHFNHQSIGKLLQPIAESSVMRSSNRHEASLCENCFKTDAIQFCKCCGKRLRVRQVESDQDSERFVAKSEQPVIARVYFRGGEQPKHSTSRRRDVPCCEHRRTCLKKSKGMINIKQIGSSSSQDKIHASLVVSVLNRENAETKRLVARRERCDDMNNKQTTKSEANIVTTFSVDFASTPIKLAPKTSTPIRRFR